LVKDFDRAFRITDAEIESAKTRLEKEDEVIARAKKAGIKRVDFRSGLRGVLASVGRGKLTLAEAKGVAINLFATEKSTPCFRSSTRTTCCFSWTTKLCG